MKQDKLTLLIEKLMDFLYSDASKEEKEVMVYGAKILLSTLVVYILTFILASILQVAPLALTAAIVAGIVRLFSGGVQVSTFRGCILLGTFVFTLLGLIAHYLELILTDTAIFMMLAAVFAIGSFVIYYYAPVDNKKSPIDSIYKRAKLKIHSLIILFILSTFALIIFLLSDSVVQYVLAGSLGTAWQLFTVTPLAHKLFNS